MFQSATRTIATSICLWCIVVFSLGCDSTCRPERDAIVIDNGSFEINGAASLAGWTLRNSGIAGPFHDGAPGSGSWSLLLHNEARLMNNVAWQKVRGAANGDVLTLTAYVKGYGRSARGGIIRLVSGPGPLEGGPHPWVASDSYDWVKLTLTDTLSLSPGDSVWVVLSSFILPDSIGGIMETSYGLYDDVRVVRNDE